ncbi:protein kinase [Curtobacterium sp. MCBD17_023]|uniref:protein kinase domain-containing protein n=1 Tax=Curtobacterium sp. MCBD17_023 TaxID=2175657 RepID=UPI000D970499|nr:protein kinase [Curtobacterium sp. MCBD17_023]PYY51913.1 serine/threonine protein kinase [Curtobacterium sp. MCBD17_023]
MQAGDVLNGYTLLADFSVVGAGLSRWTFATKGGREYFVKEFLSPTYPEDSAPGSDRVKARKRERCAAFEARHAAMQTALAPLSTYGGNLIVTLDFFRAGAKYYKTTERVESEDLGVAGIAALPFRQRLVLLKSAAHSLKILHDLRIVHGDLKPDNVLVKRTDLGYTSKLIDFDNAYVAGDPPPPAEIVGTINYYSPELLGYIQEDGVAAADLGTAADIFALGLIFSEFLTGQLPAYDRAYGEPAVAARSGVVLRVDRTSLDPALADLVDRMLLADPAARPTIGQVHAGLMGLRGSGEAVAPTVTPAPSVSAPAAAPAPPAPAAAPAASGGLRGKLVRPAATPTHAAPPVGTSGSTAPAADPSEATPPPAPSSGLKGKLLGRTPRDRRPDRG